MVADIGLDNPNIWYEVGYARAADKPLVMICSTKRGRFPFDIQHRSIIRYSTESLSDFEKLRHEITERLTAVVAKHQERIDNDIRKSKLLELASNISRTPGYDLSVLEQILQSVQDYSQVNSEAISRPRYITAATIDGALSRAERAGLVLRSGQQMNLTEHGVEMLNYFSSYLRPMHLH